ncbi:unnamed protein product, partial [Effrenium voratum]
GLAVQPAPLRSSLRPSGSEPPRTARKVRLQEQPSEVVNLADAVQVAFFLQSERTLVAHGVVTMSDADVAEALATADSGPERPIIALFSADPASHKAQCAQVQREDPLFPVKELEDCRLRQCEVLLFLHMLHILLRTGKCSVSGHFLRLIGGPCRVLRLDLMLLTQRYLHFCCKLGRGSKHAWNGSGFCALLERSAAARAWWEPLQDTLQGAELRGAARYEANMLRAAGLRFQQSEVSEPWPVPDVHFLVKHNTLVSAEDALPCPRVLQPPTAAQHDVLWGNGDGFPNTVRPDNMVATPHIFARVAASVPCSAGELLFSLMRGSSSALCLTC